MDVRTNYADLFYRETDSLSVLEQNVKDFPASAVARFSLLCHYKKNNNPEFEKFADQTSLYFNNSYWLREQLAQAGLQKEPPASFAGDSSHTHPETEVGKEFIPENNSPETATVEDTRPLEKNIDLIENSATPVPAEFMSIDDKLESTESKSTVSIDAPIVIHDGADFSVSPEGVVTEFISDEFSLAAGALANPGNGQENNSGNLILDDEKPVVANEAEDFPVEQFASENETLSEISEIPAPTQAAEFPEVAASSNFGEYSEETPEAVETSENESVEEDIVAFEPLHTIDYFASQGIKIKEEALMDDKLGQQVKSFTAWLKSMKKLHPGKLPEQNEVIERIIQSSAEQSNADAEVLTEAMAEVLIKQNKVEKAVEMYQKLSLINPSKSTYFAAKIESLKTN